MPFFALLIVFVVIPIVTGIYRSFTDWAMSSRDEINFVALENYEYLRRKPMDNNPYESHTHSFVVYMTQAAMASINRFTFTISIFFKS